MANYLITKDEKKKLELELDELLKVKRPEVIERIKEARGFGDLSENSEYDAAKDEQAFVESKINELEEILRKAEIISGKVDTSEVSIGNHITYENVTNKTTHKYQIVGVGAEVLEGTISSETPVAKALLGKVIGEVVEVEVPKGKVKLKVKDIK